MLMLAVAAAAVYALTADPLDSTDPPPRSIRLGAGRRGETVGRALRLPGRGR